MLLGFTVRFVTGDPVTHKSQPSPGLAAGAFSLLAVVGGVEAQAVFCRRRHQPRRPPPGSPGTKGRRDELRNRRGHRAFPANGGTSERPRPGGGGLLHCPGERKKAPRERG